MARDYPKTASEYAQMLNDKSSEWESQEEDRWAGRLASDSEHWAKQNVHTGEELARYLAISHYVDAYKDVTGSKLRNYNFDNMSIEDLELATEDLYDDYRDYDFDYDYDHDFPLDADEEFPDPLAKMNPDPWGDDQEEIDIETDWQHTPKHAGMGRPVESLGYKNLREFILESLKH